MDNPGIYSLTKNGGASDLAIAGAGTFVCDVVDGLEGMTGVALQAQLAYGSGGSAVKAYCQTTLDQGNNWIDVACFLFEGGTAKVVNLSADTPVTSPVVSEDGALPNDSTLNGILGDRLRCKVVVTGTFANSVLSVRANVR